MDVTLYLYKVTSVLKSWDDHRYHGHPYKSGKEVVTPGQYWITLAEEVWKKCRWAELLCVTVQYLGKVFDDVDVSILKVSSTLSFSLSLFPSPPFMFCFYF